MKQEKRKEGRKAPARSARGSFLWKDAGEYVRRGGQPNLSEVRTDQKTLNTMHEKQNHFLSVLRMDNPAILLVV